MSICSCYMLIFQGVSIFSCCNAVNVTHDRSVDILFSEATVKILKFGTPQTIAIIGLKIEKFDVTLH